MLGTNLGQVFYDAFKRDAHPWKQNIDRNWGLTQNDYREMYVTLRHHRSIVGRLQFLWSHLSVACEEEFLDD